MKETVEINGVKFEVDMDTAKRIDTFHVGDSVRLLKKGYNGHEIKDGVIVGFYAFKELPTIQVAYFTTTYGDNPRIEFENINAETDNYEIMPALPHESELDRNAVVESLDNEIEKAKAELQSLQSKKKWFVKHYAEEFPETNQTSSGD